MRSQLKLCWVVNNMLDPMSFRHKPVLQDRSMRAYNSFSQVKKGGGWQSLDAYPPQWQICLNETWLEFLDLPRES